jgi:hypothetical protein
MTSSKTASYIGSSMMSHQAKAHSKNLINQLNVTELAKKTQ